MSSEKRNDEFHTLLTATIDKISSESDVSTSADASLILRVFEDVLKTGELNRGIRTLETATKILEAKYTIDELCWFDVFNCVITSGSNIKFENRKTGEYTEDREFNELFTKFDESESSNRHEKEFRSQISSVAEMIDETIEDRNDINSDEMSESFSRIISIQSGFLYGEVEIPNNLSRMKLVDMFADIGKNLDDEDFRWMMQTLREWVSMYVHAESMLANKNTEKEDLVSFMANCETPSERYWS